MSKTKAFSFAKLGLYSGILLNVIAAGYIIHEYQQNQLLLINTLEKAQASQQSNYQEQLHKLAAQLQNIEYHTNTNYPQNDLWQQCNMALRISYYHLLFLGETDKALDWLNTAIQFSEDINVAQAHGINQDLQKLKQQLLQSKLPSRQGLLAKINALQLAIDNLQIEQSPTPTAAAPAEKTLSWQDWLSLHYWHQSIQTQLNDSLNALSSGIRINSHPNMYTTIVDPDTLNQFQFNSQLLLQQAQWAVLYQNEGIYQQAISKLKANLNKYFPGQEQANIIITQLDELAAVSVQATQPHYLPILKKISEYISSHEPDRIIYSKDKNQKASNPSTQPLTKEQIS